nr:hypothetical protein Iba_chr15bCG1260 [Ipomoea batatas]
MTMDQGSEELPKDKRIGVQNLEKASLRLHSLTNLGRLGASCVTTHQLSQFECEHNQVMRWNLEAFFCIHQALNEVGTCSFSAHFTTPTPVQRKTDLSLRNPPNLYNHSSCVSNLQAAASSPGTSLEENASTCSFTNFLVQIG